MPVSFSITTTTEVLGQEVLIFVPTKDGKMVERRGERWWERVEKVLL
jgi:hypothetical protein